MFWEGIWLSLPVSGIKSHQEQQDCQAGLQPTPRPLHMLIIVSLILPVYFFTRVAVLAAPIPLDVHALTFNGDAIFSRADPGASGSTGTFVSLICTWLINAHLNYHRYRWSDPKSKKLVQHRWGQILREYSIKSWPITDWSFQHKWSDEQITAWAWPSNRWIANFFFFEYTY